MGITGTDRDGLIDCHSWLKISSSSGLQACFLMTLCQNRCLDNRRLFQLLQQLGLAVCYAVKLIMYALIQYTLCAL